jgi:phenylalanyl-tRNA synthetase alpha subunit
MPLKLENYMKGWGKNRVTKPLKKTLANRTASLLSANEIRHILNYNPTISPSLRKAIEHRAGNLRSLDVYMKNYYRRRNKK